MISYYLSGLCKKIKVSRARTAFNTKDLKSQKRNTLLFKSGVNLIGTSIITPPFFYEFGRIKINNNVYINSGCVFLDNEMITIGDNSLIGPNVTLTTANHPVDPETRNTTVFSSPIDIGCNVWIGAGVVILPGVTIGDNSVIAANSVVKTDVPKNSLFAGAPAVFKRNI